MLRWAILAGVLALTLAACGIHGATGRDSGGIIPWTPDNEYAARDIAQANCSRYDKFAVITTVHRRYGDYIAYECRWNPRRQARRSG